MRSAELTLPGFVHDVCSAVVPLALASPFFRTLPLSQYGLAFIQPDAPLAHPLDDGTAVIVERSVEQTAAGLGRDGASYARLFGPLARDWAKLESLLLGAMKFPAHPLIAARFGLDALRSASSLAKSKFRDARARALFAGLAAHSILPLEDSPSAAFGLMLGILAHAVGWPIVRGGTQKLADALAAHLRSLGGEIRTGTRVASIDELPSNSTVFCDVSPRALAAIAGSRFTPGFRAALERYRYAPGVCKVDWALDAPIPWKAPACARAGTVHVGGTLEEIAKSERDAWNGVESPRRSCCSRSRRSSIRLALPAGKHIGLGILSCAERIDQRHVGRDRGPDRTLRVRFSCSYPAAQRDAARRIAAAQCEFGGRGCGRRRGNAVSTFHAAHMETLLDDGPAYLHLLSVNSTRRWRPRPLRPLSRETGFGQVAMRSAKTADATWLAVPSARRAPLRCVYWGSRPYIP